ncbi:MAG: hypothetical protein V1929_00240 [bacterium]
MMPILAQAGTGLPQGFSMVVGVLFVLLAGAASISTIVSNHRRVPSVDVDIAKMDARFASVEMCERNMAAVYQRIENLESCVNEKLDGMSAALKRDTESIQRSGEARAAKIHDRVNTILSEVSEVRGRVCEIARKTHG